MNNLFIKKNITHLDKETLKKDIKKIVMEVCKEKNINFETQRYMISFVNSETDTSNQWYSLCSSKYFNFFGKYYFQDKYNGKEIFKNEKEFYEYDIEPGLIVICLHHFYNKTDGTNKEKYIEFYIAPQYLVQGFEPGTWQTL